MPVMAPKARRAGLMSIPARLIVIDWLAPLLSHRRGPRSRASPRSSSFVSGQWPRLARVLEARHALLATTFVEGEGPNHRHSVVAIGSERARAADVGDVMPVRAYSGKRVTHALRTDFGSAVQHELEEEQVLAVRIRRRWLSGGAIEVLAQLGVGRLGRDICDVGYRRPADAKGVRQLGRWRAQPEQGGWCLVSGDCPARLVLLAVGRLHCRCRPEPAALCG